MTDKEAHRDVLSHSRGAGVGGEHIKASRNKLGLKGQTTRWHKCEVGNEKLSSRAQRFIRRTQTTDKDSGFGVSPLSVLTPSGPLTSSSDVDADDKRPFRILNARGVTCCEKKSPKNDKMKTQFEKKKFFISLSENFYKKKNCFKIL